MTVFVERYFRFPRGFPLTSDAEYGILQNRRQNAANFSERRYHRMFGKKKTLPHCTAFVDFEHWYISLERQYGVKPDMKSWKDELEKTFFVEEIAVFGDFSNPGLRSELDKIRDVTPMVFDTKNSSEHYKKDFTDFIMLDYIYQKAMTSRHTDAFIIFTGDGHFSSVVRFIINQCRKKVGIYGITNATSAQLKSAASWYHEIPSDTEVYRTYYKLVAKHFDYLTVHREFGIGSTPEKIVERIAAKNKVDKVEIAKALCQMLDDGYIYKAVVNDEKGKKLSVLKPNWELLARDGFWRHQ